MYVYVCVHDHKDILSQFVHFKVTMSCHEGLKLVVYLLLPRTILRLRLSCLDRILRDKDDLSVLRLRRLSSWYETHRSNILLKNINNINNFTPSHPF